MKLECCSCGQKPIIGDVGGNNACIEIHCRKCNKTVTAPTMVEAMSIWNTINTVRAK